MNSVETDQTPHLAAVDLVLHCSHVLKNTLGSSGLRYMLGYMYLVGLAVSCLVLAFVLQYFVYTGETTISGSAIRSFNEHQDSHEFVHFPNSRLETLPVGT